MPDNNSVPMLAPDGSVRQVPQEQTAAAVQAGGKLVTQMVSPQGEKHWVPFDSVHDAISAGGQLAPPALTVGAPQNQPAMQQVDVAGNPQKPVQFMGSPAIPDALAPGDNAVTDATAGVARGIVKGAGQTIAPGPRTAQAINTATGMSVPSTATPELQTQGAAELAGGGIEGIGEFILGNEFAKGIPLLQRAESALKAQKALKIAAEESPLVQQILSLGLKAVRTGAVSGAQSYLHEPTAASAATGFVAGAGGEAVGAGLGEAASRLEPRTTAMKDLAVNKTIEGYKNSRQLLARIMGNVATRASANATGEIISDVSDFRGAAQEIKQAFSPTYDKLREASGGVFNSSTGRYGTNAFDDATNQIARAKKVVYSTNPASTDAIRQAETELAEGQAKLEKVFDDSNLDPKDLAAAKSAWAKAGTLEDLHGIMDKAYTDSTGPAEIRRARAETFPNSPGSVKPEADPAKFVKAANKAIDSLNNKGELEKALGPDNYKDLISTRDNLANAIADKQYGQKIEQLTREYLAAHPGPSPVSKTVGGPATGIPAGLAAHYLLGLTNPLAAAVGLTAGTAHFLYSHPDYAVPILKAASKAAPLAAQAAKQIAGPAITHVFDADKQEAVPVQ